MKTILPVLLAVAALAAPAAAQTADQKAARAAVDDFLLRLGDGRYDTLDADFAPKAVIVVVRQRDGQWTSGYETAGEWLASLKKNQTPVKFREPIANVTLTVDSGRLAYVRADFKVVRDGKVLSTGVDQFTLVRDAGRWRIVAIAYTSIPAR